MRHNCIAHRQIWLLQKWLLCVYACVCTVYVCRISVYHLLARSVTGAVLGVHMAGQRHRIIIIAYSHHFISFHWFSSLTQSDGMGSILFYSATRLNTAIGVLWYCAKRHHSGHVFYNTYIKVQSLRVIHFICKSSSLCPRSAQWSAEERCVSRIRRPRPHLMERAAQKQTGVLH